MDRREMVSLKLQMGINPSVELAPDILRAMWQQLKRERVNTRTTRLVMATARSRDHQHSTVPKPII